MSKKGKQMPRNVLFRKHDQANPTLYLAHEIIRGLAARCPLAAAFERRLDPSENTLEEVTLGWRELTNVKLNPEDYPDADSFRHAYLAVNLMSKYPDFEFGIDKRQAAIDAWRESEQDCYDANLELPTRIRKFKKSGLTGSAIFLTAAHKIASVLGSPDLDRLVSDIGWGPGATTSLKRRFGHGAYKWGNTTPHCTANLLPLVTAAKQYLCREDGWSFQHEIVAGGKATTVLKNAEIDRFIVIEPDLNGLFQKGIGRQFRRALNSIGLLLPHSQEDNGYQAKVCSADDHGCTIDLKGASDRNALVLVWELLSKQWVELIELTRSPTCVLPGGEVVHLSKVSSMGNGFTFELETLLFWGLAEAIRSLLDEEFTNLVYGDDIICGPRTAEVLIPLLRECGHVPNLKKTFLKGPFRESCGKHYFRGVDVTPFYIRESLNDLGRLFWLANSIKLWSYTAAGSYWGLDGLLKPAYDATLAHIETCEAMIDAPPCRVPNGTDTDVGLWVDLDEACHHAVPIRHFDSVKADTQITSPKSWVSGFEVNVLKPITRTKRGGSVGYFLYRLWPQGEGEERVVYDGGRAGFRAKLTELLNAQTCTVTRKRINRDVLGLATDTGFVSPARRTFYGWTNWGPWFE